MNDPEEHNPSQPSRSGSVWSGAVLVMLCWIAGYAATRGYVGHYKTLESGWGAHLSIMVTLTSALGSFVAALVVTAFARLIPARYWRPPFAVLYSIIFVLFVVAFIAAEYPKDRAAQDQRKTDAYWDRHTDFQTCISEGRRRTLRSEEVEQDCRRRFAPD